MSERVVINPVTRISGFMEIDTVVENHIVTDARTGGLLFRGFEKMLNGRSPPDAVYFTERICGICSTAHSMASALALEDAMSIAVSEQGRYLRDFTHACEFLQNHIRHFYQFTVPDYIRLPVEYALFDTSHNDFRLPKELNDAIARHYFDSLAISRSAHEMLAVLGGKAPHNHGIFIGGITTQATPDKISKLRSILQCIGEFINNVMIPDAYAIAGYYKEYYEMGRGYGNLLSYGCFNGYKSLGTLYVDPLAYSDGVIEKLNPGEITESIYHSWYRDQSDTYAPLETVPEPDAKKNGAYSWIKSPRYRGLPFEVGPLARLRLCGQYANGISSMDRTLARVLEACKIVAVMLELLDNIIPDISVQEAWPVPENASGAGLIDTTRGALGHWLKIENGVISFYQVITPTVWNLSSMSADGMHGPGEKALIGTYVNDLNNPVELGRIIRSFDPCISCATHIFSGGESVKTLQVMP